MFLRRNIDLPFPLFSTAIKNYDAGACKYGWLEINPLTSGSDDFNGFVKTKNLGSYFKSGNLERKYLEQKIVFWNGIFGSPYDANLGDALQAFVEMSSQKWWYPFVLKHLKQFIEAHKIMRKNILPSKIYNPTYGMYSSNMEKVEKLQLADAGFSFDLPLPLTLPRNPDIIICCDASSDALQKGFPELVEAAKYAKKHGYPFPSLRYSDQHGNIFVFKKNSAGEVDKKIPTIIYFPNQIPEKMTKMHYSKEEFWKVCNSMKEMVVKHKEIIANEIKKRSYLCE